MALSDRQFKRKVFDELKNTGTIDGIKGSLRSRLVGVLQRKDPSVFDGSGPSPGSQNLWQRAANSLYVEYLNHQNYGYALSVFQPECGLTDQQVMSRDEISRVLCLERPSSLSQHLLRPDVGARNADGAPAPPSPLLLNILQAIAEVGASSARRETPTQTDDISGGASSLALRLAQIDEQHERAVATERLAPLRDAEERMASFQKECESRMRAEMLEHVRRVREHEVTQARLEEASKHRRNLAEAREDLERVHSDRLQKLRAREEAQIERVRAAEAALERAAYEHRQRLAAEHDTLRGEKEAFQREQMGRAMLRAREEEAAARREAELNAKEMSWQSRDLHATEEAQRRAVAKTREAERDIEKRREELHAEIEAVRRERATLEKDKAAALSVVLSGGKGDAATDILVMQIEDLRVQLDKANAALAKRGEATMSPEAPQLMLDDGREKKFEKKYAKTVAALHRAEADAETAREEVIPLRVEIERIEYERKEERRERGEALAMAEAFKVRAEVAEKRVDDAVKRAKDAWATVESTKKFMRELMDEEVKKRIYQEQRANALRAAAEIPGVTPEQLGLQRGLIDGANALVDENGEYVSHDTAVNLMMKELEGQHQTQKEALAAYERKLMYERQIEEATARMDAAKLAANKMRDEASKKAQIERAVLEAEITARLAMEEAAKVSGESYADAYADDTFEAADEEVAAVASDAPAVTASPPKSPTSPTSRPKSPVGAKSPKKTSPRVSGEIEEVYEEDFVPDELEDETGDDVF